MKKSKATPIKVVKDGAVSSSMFALMAKKRAQWKIVTMTFPK